VEASTVEPTSATIPAEVRPDVAAASYQRWGWPVTVSRNQVRLSLAPDTVALIIPTLIATEVMEILTARRCLPAVLEHPYAPGHRVLLPASRTPWRCPGRPRFTGSPRPCCYRRQLLPGDRCDGCARRTRIHCGCAGKSMSSPQCAAPASNARSDPHWGLAGYAG
jgi:hypothetical protein